MSLGTSVLPHDLMTIEDSASCLGTHACSIRRWLKRTPRPPSLLQDRQAHLHLPAQAHRLDLQAWDAEVQP